jgi:hypothetical protein
MSDGNAVMERFIVDQLADHYELNGFVTPANDPPDFYLYSDSKTMFIGEIKTRTKFFEDWFIEDKKLEMLQDGSRYFRCVPIYVIYCRPNETTYLLNLTDDYDYELGSQGYFNKEESGRYVHLKYWERITPIQSFKGGMSSLDWK